MVVCGRDYSIVVGGGVMNGCVIYCAVRIVTMALLIRRRHRLLPALHCRHTLRAGKSTKMIWISVFSTGETMFLSMVILLVESGMFAGKIFGIWFVKMS